MLCRGCHNPHGGSNNLALVRGLRIKTHNESMFHLGFVLARIWFRGEAQGVSLVQRGLPRKKADLLPPGEPTGPSPPVPSDSPCSGAVYTSPSGALEAARSDRGDLHSGQSYVDAVLRFAVHLRGGIESLGGRPISVKSFGSFKATCAGTSSAAAFSPW